MRIGLSLSLCVLDILKEVVKEREVLAIVSGTCAREEPDWPYLIEGYHNTYWNAFPILTCQDLVRELRPRIVQPRQFDIPVHRLSQQANYPWIVL